MDCTWKLHCMVCGADYPGLEVRCRCECGGTLEVAHDFSVLGASIELELFDKRRDSREIQDRSGVWRFSEMVLPLEATQMVSKPEGNTNLYASKRVAAYAGVEDLWLKHEGENPTGSGQDRGMTVGISVARKLNVRHVVCASLGNGAASLASYAALAGLRASVFIPEEGAKKSGLAQAVAFGARTIRVAGDYATTSQLVERACASSGAYLLGSANPFRIEGQKSVVFELLQDLGWQAPDWIVLPGDDLGNCAAVIKGLTELRSLGLIDGLPRLAIIKAAGADPLYFRNCLTAIEAGGGAVEQVGAREIMDAKAQVDAAGIGADPVSCTTVAGLRKLSGRGVIGRDEKVCCILTGHLLKDTQSALDYHSGMLSGIEPSYRNPPLTVPAEIDSILRALE